MTPTFAFCWDSSLTKSCFGAKLEHSYFISELEINACVLQSNACALQSNACALQSNACALQSNACALQSNVCVLQRNACALQSNVNDFVNDWEVSMFDNWGGASIPGQAWHRGNSD
jgi:hypothetical protein